MRYHYGMDSSDLRKTRLSRYNNSATDWNPDSIPRAMRDFSLLPNAETGPASKSINILYCR